MNIRELNKPINSKTLNETLSKKFGTKINVEKFTLEQLQDARNKIRTKLSDIETNESFAGLPQNETYSKNKLFLDVLNAAIQERADVMEKGAKPDYLDFDKDGDKKEPMKKALKDKKKKPVDEATLPFDISMTKDPEFRAWLKVYINQGLEDAEKIPGHEKFLKIQQAWNAKSDMDAEIEKANEPKYMEILKNLLSRPVKSSEEFRDYMDAEFEKDNGFRKWLGSGPGAQTPQGKYAIDLYYRKDEAVGESIIREGEEDKAELVMAAKDMVDRLTGWMEDTAEMQSESMLELADAIRDEMGAQQSEQFTATVKPALEQLYSAMESTRVSLTQGVGMLTGEAETAEPMGAEPAAEPNIDMEPTVDTDDVADDFAAAEAAVGGEDEAGRAKRESINLSRRLGTILSSKK